MAQDSGGSLRKKKRDLVKEQGLREVDFTDIISPFKGLGKAVGRKVVDRGTKKLRRLIRERRAKDSSFKLREGKKLTAAEESEVFKQVERENTQEAIKEAIDVMSKPVRSVFRGKKSPAPEVPRLPVLTRKEKNLIMQAETAQFRDARKAMRELRSKKGRRESERFERYNRERPVTKRKIEEKKEEIKRARFERTDPERPEGKTPKRPLKEMEKKSHLRKMRRKLKRIK